MKAAKDGTIPFLFCIYASCTQYMLVNWDCTFLLQWVYQPSSGVVQKVTTM